MNVHEINLDVSKEPAHEPALYIGQGDKNGTTLKVNMYDNGQALTLTGYTVTFSMRSPDAQDYYEVSGTVSSNTATFLIDETYAAGHPGVTDVAYINVIDGTSSITSSSRLRVVVLPGAKDGVMPAPAYASEIEQFLDESQAAVDEIIDEAQEILDHGIPLMSASTRGGAKLGTGLTVDNDEKLNVATATSSALGVVKPDGSTITIDNDGTLHGTGVYELPTMSASTKGGAKLGNGLDVTSDVLSVSPATTSAIGGVIPDGTTITVDNDGKIHGANTYTLPPATTSTLGGVIPDGSTISVDSDGTIHGTGLYTLPTMSASTKGGAKLGSGLSVDSNDALNLAPATTSALGGVKPDGSTITVDNDGTIHGASTYSLPTMSDSTKGGAKVGTGLAMTGEVLGLSGESYTTAEKTKLAGIESNANNYTLPAATTSTLGGVKPDGTTVTIDNDGTIHSTGSTIPTMSASTKGGAKLGEGLSVDSSDKLNLGPLTKHSTGATDGSALYGVQADGWASQTTTTGKNLMPPKSSDESSGITFTKNPDGSIKIYGTSTSSITSYYTTITLASGTYTLSTGVTLPTGVSVGVGSGTVYAGSSSVTFTKSSSGSANCFIGISNGAQVDVTIYPQLEVGSSPTTYEPYTGGTASPNPSYPQFIKVARGRNLSHCAIGSIIDQGLTYNALRDSVTVSGTMTGTAGERVIALSNIVSSITNYTAYSPITAANAFMLEPGSYTLSANCDNKCEVFLIYGAINGTVNAGTAQQMYVTSTTQTATANISSQCYGMLVIHVIASQNESVNRTVRNIQLEQGSTPTPYVPYGYVGLEVHSSNIWGGDAFAKSVNNSSATFGEDIAGRYVIQSAVGMAGAGTLFDGPFEENTQYTLILYGNNDSYANTSNIQVVYTDSSVMQPSLPKTSDSVTVNVTAQGKTIQLIRGVNYGGGVKFYYDKCGLFEGVVSAEDYQPYIPVTPIPLPTKGFAGSIGTYTDKLTVDSAGGYEWDCRTGEEVFDGSSDEAWTTGATETSGYYRLITTKTENKLIVPASNDDTAVILSTTHRAVSASSTYFKNTGISLNRPEGYVMIYDPSYQSVSAWTTYLASNPMTVLYALRTPTTEQGYIDLPSLPEGATVTIPELDNLGVDYWVSGIPEVTQYGLDMQARLQGEIDEAEQAIADLSAKAALYELTDSFTTNSGGYFSSGINPTNYVIVGCQCEGYSCLPFVSGGGWQVAVAGYPQTDYPSLMKNQTFLVTIMYRAR